MTELTQAEYQRQLSEYNINVALQRAMRGGRTAEGRLIPGATFSGREAHEQLMALGITDPSTRSSLIKKFTYGVYGRREMPIKPTAPAPYSKYTPSEQTKIQAWSEKYKMSPTPETIQKEILAKPSWEEITKFPKTPFAPSPRKIEEQIRYEKLGYPESQAGILARESLAKGGMTFTPGAAQKIIAKERAIPEAPSFIGGYRRGEEWARRKITYPIGKFIYEKTGLTGERAGALAGATAPTWITPGLTFFPTQQEREFQVGRSTGQIFGWKEKPLKTAGLTTAFFLLPKGLSYIGTAGKGVGVSKLATTFPKTAKVTGFAVKGGLLTSYVGFKGVEIAKEPTWYKKGFKLGEIEATELAPMFAGGYTGAKVWPKVEGWWATRGREKIPTEKLVPIKVIMGKERFPTAPTEKHYKLFMESRYRLPGEKLPAGYHAYPKAWSSLTIGKGESELPGAYISYAVSPHFAKVSGVKYKFYGGKLFTPYGKPGVMYITPEKFVKGYTTKLGYAGVPGIKTEVEAVIPPGTQLFKTGGKYYFTWKGTRIPIDTFKTTPSSEFSKLAGPLGKVSLSYRGLPSYPITTPSSYLFGSLASLMSSYKPSKVSYAPSYKPSQISYKPSKISFLSYKPSYRPSAPSMPSASSLRKMARDLYGGTPYISKPKRKKRVPFLGPLLPLLTKKEKVKIKIKKIKQPQKYTPSLVASILRITARKKPYVIRKKGKGVFEFGFLPGIRPIIRRK